MKKPSHTYLTTFAFTFFSLITRYSQQLQRTRQILKIVRSQCFWFHGYNFYSHQFSLFAANIYWIKLNGVKGDIMKITHTKRYTRCLKTKYSNYSIKRYNVYMPWIQYMSPRVQRTHISMSNVPSNAKSGWKQNKHRSICHYLHCCLCTTHCCLQKKIIHTQEADPINKNAHHLIIVHVALLEALIVTFQCDDIAKFRQYKCRLCKVDWFAV